MPFPRCRLVVPIHNALAYLRPMLESLFEHTPKGLYELVLSDDASDPQTRDFLAKYTGRAKVLFSEANRGFAAACNAGAAGCEAEFIIFLNSDLEFREGWLERMMAAADQDERIGVVGCRLLYPDGTIQHGGVFLREDRLDRNPLAASHDHVGRPGDDPEANRTADVLAVTAAAILVRTKAFREVDGFDEAYRNGLEDVDLCLKIGRKEWRVLYDPKCVLVHHESKSGAGRFASAKDNERLFHRKWLGKVCPEVLVSPEGVAAPHPDWRPMSPFRDVEAAADSFNARIAIRMGAPVAATALTLESVFAARIGLYDSIRVVLHPGDADGAAYLGFCEGLDDSLSWSKGESLEDMIEGATEDFVAILEPGTVATQGWLARLIRWLEQDGVGIVGPMLSGVAGAQDGLALLPPDATGAFHPNDLSMAFAQSFRGQVSSVGSLHPACLVMRIGLMREALQSGAASIHDVQRHALSKGLVLAAAKDVFIHRDQRGAALARAA